MIKYNVYVNAVLTGVIVGSGRIVYGEFGTNTISVEAVDSAGNKSAAATITVVIEGPIGFEGRRASSGSPLLLLQLFFEEDPRK